LLRSRWAFCVGDEGDLDDEGDLEPAPPVFFVAGFGGILDKNKWYFFLQDYKENDTTRSLPRVF